MMEYTNKQHFVQKILSMLISLTLMVSLLPSLQMTAYAAGDITLSVQSDTLSVIQDGTSFGKGYGQELTSGEAGSTSASPGIKIYYTDYNSGLPAGQVETMSLTGFTGGSGIGMFHAQENNSTMNYWYDDYATGNMVIAKTDGSSFQFKNLDVMFGDNVVLVIKGYLQNNLAGTVEYTMNSVSGSAVAKTLNTSDLPASIFGNVDKVTITGRNYNGNADYDGRLDTVVVFFAKSVTVGDPIIPDTTAPVLFAVNVSNIGMNTAALHFTSDEAGTFYYLVCPASSAAPSAADIIAQGTAAAKGSGAAAASANTVNISGLAEGTAYKGYVVEKDASSNVSAVSSASFTTAARTVISSAAIAVTAPVKGAIPSTAASPESAANYTLSAAAWNGNPAKFLGGTAYSIGFTLTPNDGYKFTEDTTVAVTGAAVTKVLNSNGTISVTAGFPALEAAELVGIAVKTQPAKTAYTYGENFVPDGLTITKTFDDGTTVDLTYDDSTKSNFAFIPARLTAGTSAVTLTCGGKTANIPITVAKQAVAAPVIPNSTYTGETQTAAVADNSFYTVTANEGGMDAGSYTVTLTLKDPENYKWSDSESADKNMTFTIVKAAASLAMKTAAASVPAQGKAGVAVTLSLPTGAKCGTPACSDTIVCSNAIVNGTTLTFNVPASLAGQTGKITVPVTGAKNYNDYSITVTVTSVAKTEVTIKDLTAVNSIYSGSASAGCSGTPSYTPGGFTGTLNYEYYLADGVTKTTAINSGAASEGAAPVNAGSYKVIASIPADDENYTGSVTLGFTIDKASSAITIPANQSKVFNGSAVTAGAVSADILYSNTGDGAVTVKWYEDNSAAKGGEISAPINAGTYWIGVSAAAGVNYAAAGEVAQKITITAATATITVVGIPAQGYTGAQITPAIIVKNGSITLNENTDYTVAYGMNKNAGTNAGSATIKAVNGGNYAFADASKTFTISPAALTVIAAGKSKTYGETDPTLSYEVRGWQGTDSASLLTGALSRIAGETVGSYAISAGTLSAGSNYTIQYTGASLTIGKADVALNVSVSPSAAKPGKTVTVTVRAVNSAADTLVSGASQPAGVILQAPDGSSIALTKSMLGAAGTYTGYYIIPGNAAAGSALIFTAAAADSTGNYTNPLNQSAVLTVTAMSAVNLILTADKTAGVTYGDSITYTAQVEKANPSADQLNTLDGTVTFWLGDPATGKQLAVRTIGTDALTVTLGPDRLTKGTHTITVVYSGNAEFGTARQSLAASVAARTLSWDAGGLSSIKIFDGTLDAPITGELKVSGLVGSDDPGFTYDKAATSASYGDSNPGTGKPATVTVTDAALTNPNYTLPTEKPTFKGTVTAVPEIAAPTEAEPHGYQLKLEMETGLGSVPDAITAADASLSTPEAVKARLQLRIEDVLGTGSTAVKDFDLTLWISNDSGVTWEKATADNFPAGGITVVIPWNKLGLTYEQAQHYNFAATHMFAAAVNGHTPGTTENPAWTVTPDGLQLKLDGLSPVAVGYKTLPFITFNTNGGSSAAASTYTALSGKLASLPVPTRSGYSFGGWYTQSDGGDKINTNTVFTANRTIYAHWNANGSTAVSSTGSTTAGTGLTSPQTGDSPLITFWGGMLLAGLFGLAAIILLRRRREHKNAC